MKLVLGLIVGAVIGALIGYLVWGRQVGELQTRVTQLEQKTSVPPPANDRAVAALATVETAGLGGALGINPNVAVISISGAFGEECKAKVYPPRIGNKKNFKVFWIIDGEDSQCGRGNWRLVLHFENAANGTPYNGEQDIVVLPGEPRRYKIKNSDNDGIFPYTIRLVQTSGPGAPKNYVVADPELQIEM